ncbi:MAG TPA: hypothetical protein PLL00_02170 [Bacteroidia bacterium]|jgi:hypothetical protein|nr:hypothetical protein [Bacteroidia bacterium]
MKTILNMKQFYKELGKLLYAIAFADNKVSRQEVVKLEEIVSKEFAPLEHTSDSSGMNQAYYASFEFEDCIKNKITAKEAFTSFLEFVDANIMEIDPSIIVKTIKATKKVAASYYGENKKEREMIKHIEEELTKLEDIF